VELCKQKIANRTYIGYIDPVIQSTIESNFCPKTQSLNEIDRLSREYYYADHMNAILGVYTELDEVTNLQCDYLELLEKCEGLETELSKSKMMSKSFESVQFHAINLELELQQCKEKIKNDMLFKLIEIVLFIVDYGCSKHMTGNLKLLINFVEKKSTCFIRDLKGNDLLTGSRGTDLYLITLQDLNSPNPICLMAKATSSQAWLWHRRLSHLNFNTVNLLSKNDIVVGIPKLKFIKDHLFSSCELVKAKRKSFHSKLTPSSKRRLHLLHMDLCGPMRVASINGKRYVLVIVDDYSRYTWTHFLRTLKDRGGGTRFQLPQRFIAACSYPTIKYKDIMKAQVTSRKMQHKAFELLNQERYEHVGRKLLVHKVEKIAGWRKEIMLG
nr:retrovirus-related Pol polyprotein from transposon TNT 1-94 [Tanacetum cinerariifolium]